MSDDTGTDFRMHQIIIIVSVLVEFVLRFIVAKSPSVRGVREQLDSAGREVVGDEVNKQLTRCPRGLAGS